MVHWARIVVLASAQIVAAQTALAAELRLSPQVRALLPDEVQRSLRRVATALAQRATHKSEALLYFEQLEQLQQSLAEAQASALGAFSYFFRGAHDGQASGDFIDTTPLSDGRLLIRFGDVMGHDKRAATTSFTLQKIMRSPAIAPRLDAVYRGEQGLIDALGVLETVVQQDDLNNFSYYTLTSTLVDPVKKTLETMFAGSDAFYLLRNTEAGLPTVEQIYDNEASTVFVSLQIAVVSAYEKAATAVPLTVNYESGDILVYFSDGLLERRTAAEATDDNSIRALLPRLLTDAVLHNSDQNFSENFAAHLYREIARLSTTIEPDDCSILAIKLR